MPQLVAMIVVVVGAIIYMFQTFGGTGDKIVGVAQKTSVVTEIINLRDDLKYAASVSEVSSVVQAVVYEADGTTVKTPALAVTTLKVLAESGYFPEQIREQLTATNITTTNIYSAISFGAGNDMELSLVSDVSGAIPGIFVDLSQGGLETNAGFLESQVASDLAGVASFDRGALEAEAGDLPDQDSTTLSDLQKRTPLESTEGTDSDGKFIIYFKNFGASEVVK